MYAIVAASGKQFRVTEGDRIVVDQVQARVGETVRLDSVLMLGGDGGPLVGRPFVNGAFLEATVLSHRAGDKIIVFHFKSRKHHKSKTGHRQLHSELKIATIHAPGGERAKGQDAGEPAVAAAPAPAKSRRPAAGKTSKKKSEE
jgi:large subunit ribosomal protein L21